MGALLVGLSVGYWIIKRRKQQHREMKDVYDTKTPYYYQSAPRDQTEEAMMTQQPYWSEPAEMPQNNIAELYSDTGL